jgi:hypothetical protein
MKLLNIFKRSKKIYFKQNLDYWPRCKENFCIYTGYLLGGVDCCLKCKFNKGYDLRKKWVKCTK